MSLCCCLWAPFGCIFLEVPCRAEKKSPELLWGGGVGGSVGLSVASCSNVALDGDGFR